MLNNFRVGYDYVAGAMGGTKVRDVKENFSLFCLHPEPTTHSQIYHVKTAHFVSAHPWTQRVQSYRGREPPLCIMLLFVTSWSPHCSPFKVDESKQAHTCPQLLFTPAFARALGDVLMLCIQLLCIPTFGLIVDPFVDFICCHIGVAKVQALALTLEVGLVGGYESLLHGEALLAEHGVGN